MTIYYGHGETKKSIPEEINAGINPFTTTEKPSDLALSGSNNRAERTPGAVAVSGIYGRELAGDYSLPLPASPGQTHSPDDTTPNKCGRFVVLSECESGQHHFAKRLDCNQEWCPVCGEDDSAAHKHRQAKWIPKVQQLKEMGYFVIEFPDIYRQLGEMGTRPDGDTGFWCYSKADLRATTDAVVNALAGKRCGRKGRVGGYFKRGLSRWHWFGDKATGKWNPHINVIVESGFIEPEKLEEIKTALRQALNVPDLIVNYSYTDMPGKMVHAVRYITRATFRNYNWNVYMANELCGFRNMRWWGDWKQEPVWTMDETEEKDSDIETILKFADGKCPICGLDLKVHHHNHKTGEPVRWSQPVDSIFLQIWGAEEIGKTGYYQIPHQEYNGEMLSPGNVVADRAKWHSELLEIARKYRAKLRDAENESWWESILNEGCSSFDYCEE